MPEVLSLNYRDLIYTYFPLLATLQPLVRYLLATPNPLCLKHVEFPLHCPPTLWRFALLLAHVRAFRYK